MPGTTGCCWRRSDAAVVWKHGAADRGAAGADGVNVQSGRGQNLAQKGGRDGAVSEKSLKMSRFSAFVFRTWEGIGHKRMPEVVGMKSPTKTASREAVGSILVQSGRA